MKRLVLCVAVMAVGLTLQAREEKFEDRLDASDASSISIDHAHGNIEVRGWDKDEVVIKGVKIGTGSHSDNLDDIRVEMSRQGSEVRVELIRPKRLVSFGWGKLQVNYELYAPRGFSVELDVAHGSTTLSEFDGSVMVKGAHGKFRGDEFGSNLVLEWAHGSTVVDGVNGNVNLSGRHGSTKIKRVGGDLVADTSHGNLTAESLDGAVTVESSHGSVRVSDNRSPVHPYRISSSHGSITLDLPDDAGMDLDASVAHGSIRSDRNLDIRKKRNRASVNQALNSGGPSVVLEARHGSIKIQ